MKSYLILLLPMQGREFRHSGVLRGGPHPTERVAAVPAGGGGPGLVLEVSNEKVKCCEREQK